MDSHPVVRPFSQEHEELWIQALAEARERGDAKAELVISSPGGQLVRFEKALTDG